MFSQSNNQQTNHCEAGVPHFEGQLVPQIQVLFSEIQAWKKPQVSRGMLPQSNNQQTFHCEAGVPHFEGQLTSMSFTTAIYSFRWLPRLRLSLVSEGTDKYIPSCLNYICESPYVSVRTNNPTQFKECKKVCKNICVVVVAATETM